MTLRQLWFLPILAAVLLSGVTAIADASALAQPPSAVRMVIFNAIDGANLTSTAVTVNLAAIGPGGPCQSISFINDAATDATGNSDLLVDLSGGTAATPTNGTAGSTTLRIIPGQEAGFDGKFATLSMKSRSTAIPVRVYITY